MSPPLPLFSLWTLSPSFSGSSREPDDWFTCSSRGRSLTAKFLASPALRFLSSRVEIFNFRRVRSSTDTRLELNTSSFTKTN
ncbi:Protein of unknown function [Pyronema omphalodes CBS 100304]|uniref:Uncharacterized protein n=1 Tax=Pyronema omphalodes (strain CBS 100304) TaxID=1076935 RepID=U4LKN9_PYROM|nr:Protein of unknown function [Pyronema omphalodes CBS 100304]